MKNILWLCNVILPQFCEIFEIKRTYAGGWMSGLMPIIQENKEFTIQLCFPIYDKERVHDGERDNIKFYSLYVGNGNVSYEDVKKSAEKIVKEIQPDIVHIWGSEFRHAYAMGEVCKNTNIPYIVDIQGIDAAIGKMYCEGIPVAWQNVTTETKESILEDMRDTLKRSLLEHVLIKNANYVIGRTSWDLMYISQINSNLKYFHCDRVLRCDFYRESRKWEYEKCKRFSIFVSQAGYPLKGVHFLLEAIQYIKKRFPFVDVRIGGDNQFVSTRVSPYGKYLLTLIKEYGLEENVVFLGRLTAEEMINEYLKCNLFVCCSILENNSNSICEAMYLGTPVISSFVGGLLDILEHNKTGIFYSHNDVRMLAGQICNAFDNPKKIKEISLNAICVAEKRHNRERITKRMLEIYHKALNANY